MFLYIRHLIPVVFFVLSLQACLDKSAPPSDLDMGEMFSKNVESFKKLNDIMVTTNLTRVTFSSAFPEKNDHAGEMSEIRRLLKKIGAKIGAQMSEDKKLVEVIYWSTGIVNRGNSKLYIRREGGIEKDAVYRRRIAKGEMKCSSIPLEDGWRICTNYGT